MDGVFIIIIIQKYSKENFITIKRMVMENIHIKMDILILGIGIKIYKMGSDMKKWEIVVFILVNFIMEKKME